MLSSNEMRLAFVKQSVTFLRQHGLDGIDVDFDYGGGQDAEPQLMRRLILLLGVSMIYSSRGTLHTVVVYARGPYGSTNV